MYFPNPSNDISHQTFTQFKSELPLLPFFSPLILDYPHTLDWVQWEQQINHCGTSHGASSNLQDSPASDTSIREHPDGTLNDSDTDSKNIKGKNHVIHPLMLERATELSTGENSYEEEVSTAAQTNNSTCPEPNSAAMDLPPVLDVGAFHAHAHIVESIAPAMQRGFSHRAEVMSTGDICDLPKSPSVLDLEFLSFSPLFSSQHDNALLSPSWKLELTLASSWQLAAESAICMSQPFAHGSSLVRRPATRRKGLADPKSPKSPIRKSPYLNGCRTLFDLRRKRSPTETGILKSMNSPALKSRGYRVRFEELETR